MKDCNGRTLSLEDHIVFAYQEGAKEDHCTIVAIEPHTFMNGDVQTCAKVRFHNGYVSSFHYESKEIRKLEIEELI